MPGLHVTSSPLKIPTKYSWGIFILTYFPRLHMGMAVAFMMLHMVRSSFGVLGFFSTYSTATGLAGVPTLLSVCA